jgi:hypothetical protein
MMRERGGMSRSDFRPGPSCKRFGSLLPQLLQEGLLDPEALEAEALGEHLATCVFVLSEVGFEPDASWHALVLQRSSATPYDFCCDLSRGFVVFCYQFCHLRLSLQTKFTVNYL